jgi:hypothetical protein
MFIFCRDGFNFSVAANKWAYCEPRINDAKRYQRAELGYLSEHENVLGNDGGDGIFGYVETPVIVDIIERHGGANRLPRWLNNEFNDIIELERIQDRLEGRRSRVYC